MGRNKRHENDARWILVGSMMLGGVLLASTLVLGALGGNPIFATLLWGVLGLGASVALDSLIRLLTKRRNTYWMLAVTTFAVVLVGVPALGATIFSDWFVAVASSAPGTYASWPPAFAVYIGFVVSFPSLAWSRDRVQTQQSQQEQRF